ncbi:uncharacterized protein LOC110716128 [Chenopodium quinoa]|uniref:uncharacterized protein LOC110716128 n=1 Tax=Chenopodium quinoa TaxID=63459 RepID=UPI000B779C62|nr:uncharacterized protein LOC110716128 [Chenopodium quinoa]
MSWDWICKSKKAGGLGMRDCTSWNTVALGKYVWKVAMKEDSMWVRWVHAVYIKEGYWWEYKPKKSAGLKTRSRLFDWGACQDNSCFLCGEVIEDRKHLFFECGYSLKCLASIREWQNIPVDDFNIDTLWKFWEGKVKDAVKKRVCYAVLAAIVYQIWYARNKALWLQVVIRPREICKAIRTEVVQRCKQMINGKWTRQQCKWLYSLHDCNV